MPTKQNDDYITHEEELYHTRNCDNCGKKVPLYRSLAIYHKQKLIGILCPTCQQAKKIQITLEKVNDKWAFYQYFPVES